MDGERQVSGQRSKLRSVSVQGELAERIGQGQLAAGTRLPSEPELAAEFGVSRATLREALRALEGQGLVHRRWGSGTYVTERTRVANSLEENFGVSDAIRAAGIRPAPSRDGSGPGQASASEAERLELDPGQDVLVVERVRTADGRPVVFSRDILPGKIIGDRTDIADQMLRRSIYEVLERDLGIVINHGVASFRPVTADRTVARLLGTRAGELLLYLWQVDYAQGGAAVLSSHEYHLADAFDFSVVRRGPGRRFS